MSEMYVGEIRLFAGNYAPENWSFCNGTILPISDYEMLFALIGTTYGGNGITDFALPNLPGRVVCGAGQGPGLTNYVLGQTFGTAGVWLADDQLPAHKHGMVANSAPGGSLTPDGTIYSSVAEGYAFYVPDSDPGNRDKDPSENMLQASGGESAHYNVMPSFSLNYIIALTGLFPSQN